jgi:hypothetical protein
MVDAVEVCAYVALLAFLLYARLRTHRAHGKSRWGVVYSLCALAFALWLVRIWHLLVFGRDR